MMPIENDMFVFDDIKWGVDADVANDPRLSEGAADLLTAVGENISDFDPDATFDFHYFKISGGGSSDRVPEQISMNFTKIEFDYIGADRSDLQKLADSIETQLDSDDVNVLITPSGPGGINGDDFNVTFRLREIDVSKPEVAEQADPRADGHVGDTGGLAVLHDAVEGGLLV
jgi:hypothetical protein